MKYFTWLLIPFIQFFSGCAGPEPDCVNGDAICSPAWGAIIHQNRAPGARVPRFIFVTSSSGNAIARLSVGPQGTLTLLGETTIGVGQRGGATNPDGNELYVCTGSANQVYALSIDSSTGDLALLRNEATTQVTGCWDVIVHPGGRFLYSANSAAATGDTISTFSIGGDGAPAFQSLATDSNGASNIPSGMVIDSTGSFLYSGLINGTDGVAAWKIQADGSLAHQADVVGCGSTNIYEIAMDPGGRFIYGGTAGGALGCAYRINSPGNLATIGTFSIGTPTFDSGLTFDVTGAKLFVADTSGNLATYPVDQTTGLPAGTGPALSTGAGAGRAIAVEPTGRFVYALNSSGVIHVFRTDEQSGFLSGPIQSLSAIGGAQDLIIISK